MVSVKVFVRHDNIATIICPSCKTAKKAAVGGYLHKKHALNVRCRCGQIFTVHLDFRRHYRKQTRLPGTYTIIRPPAGGGGVVHIKNISRSGIGFTVSGLHNIEKDHILLLEFRLNDKKQTKLKKEAVVRSVRNNDIGCEFLDKETEKALGFFLQP
ncbi:PilZ domain-containing protein [Desulfolithobacter sp.]